jgi:mono/diheme cytochrome c family protein
MPTPLAVPRILTAAVALLAAAASPAAGAASTAVSDQIKRGEYLARAGDCFSCHTKPGGQALAGGLRMDTPFGALITPNITPDDETGIGKWTADDLYRAMHDGVNKAGQDLYPVMPYTFFTKVTRADVDDIYAYLRTVKPVSNRVDVNQLRFPFDIRLTQMAWRELYFTEGTFAPDPKKSAQWNRGAYLVEGLGHCGACHSPRTILGGIKRGEQLTGAHVDHWFALNLTGDLRRGIGKFSDKQLVAFLKRGAVKGKTTAVGPMREVVHNSLSYLTDDDLMAIAVYLKSQPARGKPSPAASSFKPNDKAAHLYLSHCAPCHQAKGIGMPGAIPPLAGNPVVLAPDPSDVLSVVLGGVPARGAYMAMPSFASLRNDDIANIANYVRTSWGNTASQPVRADNVQAIRSAIGPAAMPKPVTPAPAKPVAVTATPASTSAPAPTQPSAAMTPAPATAPAVTTNPAPATPAPADAAKDAPQRVAQAPAATSDGWYTADEASKGKALFQANCQGCHGSELGGGVGPALKGPSFAATWGNKTLGALVSFEHSKMPLTAPGSLTLPDYQNLAAFILQQNGLPAGSKPLSSGADNGRVLGLK